MIFDFTWSGLNNTSERLSPMEAMRFGCVLQCIPKQVFTTDLCLGPVYLSKVDLTDAYMRFGVRIEYVPFVAFLVPKKNSRDTQLVVFHLCLPMGTLQVTNIFAWQPRQ